MKALVLAFLISALLISVANAQATVFIVRHAEKAQGSGDDPDLSEAGRLRAEALAKTLKDAGITGIYATEFKRTQQTATPLAKMLGIKVATVPGKDSAGLVAKLHESHGNILVVGHGNTIPELIKGLGIATSISIGENDYDNLFLIVLDKTPRLIRLHYP